MFPTYSSLGIYPANVLTSPTLSLLKQIIHCFINANVLTYPYNYTSLSWLSLPTPDMDFRPCFSLRNHPGFHSDPMEQQQRL